MAKAFNKLSGDQLLERDESNNELSNISTNSLNGKNVGLYFAAYSNRACQNLTPKLAIFFKGYNSAMEEKLEIVFISSDEDQVTFDAYFKKMPWKALPFSEQDRAKTLRDKFSVENIPTLIQLSATCELEFLDEANLVHDAYGRAVSSWCKGKNLFMSREPREHEYVWYGIICHQCYMSPLFGSRHGCINKQCHVDFCEICLPETKHEHPLVEYLVPKQQYSIEQLFKLVPHVLNPTSEEKFETKTIWEDGVKSVGFYFSAHWCEPCRAFTPKLAEAYK